MIMKLNATSSIRTMIDRGKFVKEWIACGERCPKPKGFLPWYVHFRLMTEVARGISFLHSNRSVMGSAIIHSAIRPANILLDCKFDAKICKVEQALLNPQCTKGVQALGHRTLGVFVGRNAQYIAPEYLRTKVYNEKTDIYAFGITVLEMLTGNFMDAFGITEEAIEDAAAFENVLDPNAGSWDVDLAKEVAALGLRCASLDRRSRPDMMDTDIDILGIFNGVAGKVQLAAPEEDP
ncbi:hypothetical protein CBR_g6441 [Chara braunii]|uniref:Protein kinase domain-containing protein n=1 Tax=Chara braunii TaxID=69332 RepID=A0A388KJT3_CHABU|nr:hypothetical protein CBR_g6441 [Chara braunii]|eukprot:GBG70314.1 hypothetical protein CBR_g6441 [Chara braunii]